MRTGVTHGELLQTLFLASCTADFLFKLLLLLYLINLVRPSAAGRLCHNDTTNVSMTSSQAGRRDIMDVKQIKSVCFPAVGVNYRVG